jgi:hypothetical protein
MKKGNSKANVALTSINLLFWIWAFVHMKQHGDYLAPPLLTAFIAMMLAALIQYRAVLAARAGESNVAQEEMGSTSRQSQRRGFALPWHTLTFGKPPTILAPHYDDELRSLSH